MTEDQKKKALEAEPDEAIKAYEKFAAEPLVQACGGVDKASFCCGYDVAKEKYDALLDRLEQAEQEKNSALQVIAELREDGKRARAERDKLRAKCEEQAEEIARLREQVYLAHPEDCTCEICSMEMPT